MNCWRIFHRGRSIGGNLGIPDNTGHEHVQEKWFYQVFDQTTNGGQLGWNQRYFVNENYYNYTTRNGPVFLMLGGEGEASIEWMTAGAWIDYAKKFGALCFQLEHRFYGKSHPVENLELRNLLYLTSEQALGDIAYFIT